jgi:hypothetical protein
LVHDAPGLLRFQSDCFPHSLSSCFSGSRHTKI